jgi:hypothetical protein
MADKNITRMDLVNVVYHKVGLPRKESVHLVAIAGSGKIEATLTSARAILYAASVMVLVRRLGRHL